MSVSGAKQGWIVIRGWKNVGGTSARFYGGSRGRLEGRARHHVHKTGSGVAVKKGKNKGIGGESSCRCRKGATRASRGLTFDRRVRFPSFLKSNATAQVTMAHSMPTDAPTSHPVALAFAVAALQSGEPSGMIDGSLLQVASAQGAPKKTSEQLPGSGSDSNEVAFSQIKKSAEEDDDSAKRLARSRERNREHARRTRLRKKAQLEALQSKVKGLEAERQVLKQQIEECSIASILLGLSTGDQDETTQNLLDSNATKTDAKATKVALLAGGKRKRFVSNAIGAKSSTQQTLKVKIDGKTLLIGGGSKSHVNWKTGVFFDEDGSQKQLTPDQLEDLR